MKKIILTMSLFFSVFLFSETTNGNNLKQSVNNAFYEFMDFQINPNNVKKNVLKNSVEDTNKILGANVDKKRKNNLKEVAKSQTGVSLSNSSDYLVIANSKITYKIKNTEVKNGEAVLNVHMKAPDLTAYNSELQNYIEKKVYETYLQVYGEETGRSEEIKKARTRTIQILSEKKQVSIKAACKVFKITRQAYYKAVKALEKEGLSEELI